MPKHKPEKQKSWVVQALPSSQGALPRSVPPHTPEVQTSAVVQVLPSSQEIALSVHTQPLVGSQVSVVHSLLSSQTCTGPPSQVPAEQVSSLVQASPSVQIAPSAVTGSLHVPVSGSQLPTS